MTTSPPPRRPKSEALAHRAAAEVARLAQAPLAPGLYIVATPIGHLGDITLRALAVLAAADAVYCEDTRHSRTLLQHYGLNRGTSAYHEHNGERVRPRILAALAQDRSVALISDAGTPLISDPGHKLVRAAIAAGHAVTSIPGPSAVLAGLTAAGLPTDSFFFAGFLPPRSGARRRRLAELAMIPATLVLFEAPSRLADALADMAETLGAREAVVARELTKLHEELHRGALAQLATWAAATDVMGETVIVVAPPATAPVTDDVIAERLAASLGAMSLSEAAKAVANALGVAKARVYDIGLALKRGA